jgi:hypothetical protein
MASRRYGWSEAKIRRYQKMGRGRGELSEYIPWLRVQDVPSRGRSHRIFGRVAGRVHHLLSDLERNAFLIYDYAENVSDIREQFPLDRAMTSEIANELGVRHPVDPASRCLLVQTTDLLISRKTESGSHLLARTVKYSKDLCNRRALEKLEIERVYWTSLGVNWGIVTEREISKTVIRNLEYIREGIDLTTVSQPSPNYYRDLASEVIVRLHMASDCTVREFCELIDKDLCLPTGETRTILRSLLVTKVIVPDDLYVPSFDDIAVDFR